MMVPDPGICIGRDIVAVVENLHHGRAVRSTDMVEDSVGGEKQRPSGVGLRQFVAANPSAADYSEAPSTTAIPCFNSYVSFSSVEP